MRHLMMAAALFVLAAPARADEEKVPLDRLPKAVVDAVLKRFPKADLVSAEKDVEDGKTLYEVAITAGKTKVEVTATAAGEVVEVEKAIAATALPKPVTAALAARYPKATYRIVEEIFKVKEGKDQPVYYEVLVETADKKLVEVQLAADGKVIATEDKKADEKDK